jgi:hypothetical protein
MTDFMREVDEEVRREKLLGLWTKYRAAIIALAILAVAGTATFRIYETTRLNRAQEAGARYEAALELARAGKSTEALAAFEALVKDAPRGYADLALLRAADEIAVKDPKAGVAAYEALIADRDYGKGFQDVAHLRAAWLRLDRDDPKELEARLAPLAGANFTYRNSIREVLGLAALKRKDYDSAERWFEAVSSDLQAPGALRERADAFLGIVQGSKPPAKEEPAKEAPVKEAPKG